jgi:hypothetical protein
MSQKIFPKSVLFHIIHPILDPISPSNLSQASDSEDSPKINLKLSKYSELTRPHVRLDESSTHINDRTVLLLQKS